MHQVRCLTSDALENVVDVRVHDSHGLGGDAGVQMDLLQHLIAYYPLNSSTLLQIFFLLWLSSIPCQRRQWQPTPVLLSGKSHGQRSLVGCMQSMGSRRVGHDWMTSLSLFTFMHWKRKWQPTPVFLPRESQGWRSLEGCRLWGHTELDMTEVT